MPDQPCRREVAASADARRTVPPASARACDSAAGNAGGATGRRGEQLAAHHLERLGFTILARNVRTAGGEIDLIASFGGSSIAFVEVKSTRCKRTTSAGAPAASAAAQAVLGRLGVLQRRRLRGLALDWLRSQPPPVRSAEELRFDAIGVVIDDAGMLVALEHLEGAW